MYTFLISLFVLFLGYFLYSKVVDKIFSPTNNITPAYLKQDDVDYIPLSNIKAFLIQLLNIAGTGPIFGALLGATFGPAVFIWIVLGSIFAGAVHDYFCGMISIRHNGASFTEIVGTYLGKTSAYIMRFVSIILLLLVGTVFVTSPAALLELITPTALNYHFWIIVILIYYAISSIFPIDKIISKIYPFFAFILLSAGIVIISVLFIGDYEIPELTFVSLTNAKSSLSIWPFLFVSVACGAISGFHATQSPIISRCLKSEKDGRKIFYGSMIAESVITLIWAVLGSTMYDPSVLENLLSTTSPSNVTYQISTTLLGSIGAIIAVISVIICPITSGDTAFRSLRLTISDWFKINQKKSNSRLLIILPFLGISYLLTFLNFDILWRYFSWTNQMFACFGLWAYSTYLIKYAKKKYYSLVTLVPAIFMTAVCSTYILMSKEGLQLSAKIGYPLGIIITLLISSIYLSLFYFSDKRIKKIKNLNIKSELE